MQRRRVIIAMLFIGWVLLGPVTVLFGGCVGMGAACESLCALTSSYEAPTLASLVVLPLVTYLALDLPMPLPTPAFKVPTPPPRWVRF
jgi:hypothetical protein